MFVLMYMGLFAGGTVQRIIHPEDTVFLDFIRKCLAYDPRDRIRAKDALNHPLFTGIRGVRDIPKPVKASSLSGAGGSGGGGSGAASGSGGGAASGSAAAARDKARRGHSGDDRLGVGGDGDGGDGDGVGGDSVLLRGSRAAVDAGPRGPVGDRVYGDRFSHRDGDGDGDGDGDVGSRRRFDHGGDASGSHRRRRDSDDGYDRDDGAARHGGGSGRGQTPGSGRGGGASGGQGGGPGSYDRPPAHESLHRR